MRKYLLAAAAVTAIASPAMARDGAAYVGLEGGILFPRHTNSNSAVTGTTTIVNTVATDTSTTPSTVTTTPVGTSTTTTTTFAPGYGTRYKKGLDIDALVGYDFGMFRLEGELGYKRTRMKDITVSPAVLTAINTPVAGFTPTVPVTNANAGFDLGRTTVLSGMINGLVDFSVAPGVSIYAGGGAGRARIKMFGEHDNAWAYQLIAGISTAISPNVDLGLKYRYFQTGRLHFNETGIGPFTGTTTSTTGTTTTVTNYSSVYSTADSSRFKSHSLLASLIFNFGGAEAAPPPPPPVVEAAPPPPPPPPATQTCADGSVIDATASCPLPPPPPPPPPPAKGERG